MAVNSLKVCFGGEIRRIRVIPSDVSHLRALLEERFNLPSNYSITYKDDENDTITIQTDEELSEAIQITSEDDRKTLRVEVISTDSSSDERSQGSNFETPSLNTAFQSLITAAATTALQAAIGIPNQDPSQPSSTSPHSQDAPQVVSNVEESSQMEDEIMTHRGVVCDICGMKPILGIRYKCSVRDDFDVCESCEAADVACPYPYLKIRHPSQAPACLITVLKDEHNEEGEEEAAAARNLEQKLRNQTATFGDLRRGGRAWLKEQQQRRCGHGRVRRGRQHGNRPWCGRRMARNFAEQGQRNPEPGNTAATESKLSNSELQHEEDIKVAIQRSLEPSIKEDTHVPVAEPMQAFDPPVPIEDVPPPQYATLSRQSTQEPTDALLPPTRKKTEKVQKPMARFVADVTIPDGTEILPGTTFVKIWKMRNDGEVTFPSETKLKNVGGDLMEGPEHVSYLHPSLSFSSNLLLMIRSIAMRFLQSFTPGYGGKYCSRWGISSPLGADCSSEAWSLHRLLETTDWGRCELWTSPLGGHQSYRRKSSVFKFYFRLGPCQCKRKYYCRR